MTLTPTWKFIIIAVAVVVSLFAEIWTGIAADLEALGMSAHVYNIVVTVVSKLDLAAAGLLVYLGLRAPTIEKPRMPAPSDHLL